MKIAIVTDWLVTRGGAERVIGEMHALFPKAPIFTTVHKERGTSFLETTNYLSDRLGRAGKLQTTSLQRWYRLLGDHRPLLPWMPRAVESWDLRGFDVILSSSHAVSKGCIPPCTARHICYCHTPMRYAWEMEESYLTDFRLRGPLRSLVKHALARLRRWDLSTARRTDLFIANSLSTQERIKRIYGRESIVLHPPVDDRFFTVVLKDMGQRTWDRGQENMKSKVQSPKSYFLAVGRLVPYKRFDLLIEAANALKLPLKIAGTGPEASRLQRLVGETVELLGYVPEEALPGLYAGATAFLYPTHEDAGIALLEAQACGTPVIALGKGGALDTVVDGETGVFMEEQSIDSFRAALARFEKIVFKPEHIREHARKFSSERFREKLKDIVLSTLAHSSQSTRALSASRP